MTYQRRHPAVCGDGVPEEPHQDLGQPIATERQLRHGRGTELLAELRRRHQAALRLPPLEHSRRRDPVRPADLVCERVWR